MQKTALKKRPNIGAEAKLKEVAKTETLRHVAQNMTLDTHKRYSMWNTAKKNVIFEK